MALHPRQPAGPRDPPADAAILPASLQAARAFRLLRLLRLLKTAKVLRRLLSADGIRDAAVLAVLVVLGGGTAFAAAETTPQHPLSAWDGVWWAMTTVTTVGYGDIYPVTVKGRVIAMTVMLVGIGFVALITAAAAERFIVQDQAVPHEDLIKHLDDVSQRLANIEALLADSAAAD